VEELEINELYELFKKIFPTTTISEKDVLKLMTHFFTDISIIENKYILNVSSSILLWNKNVNIMESLDVYKNKSSEISSIISFSDLYQNYINYCHEKHFLIANKKYFEKYVGYKLKDFVVFDSFIGVDWLL